MNAVILAAGLGARLKPLTDITPKPLLPIMNKPIIDIIIEKIIRFGGTKVGVNVFYQHDVIADFLSKYSALIKISLEDELAGTGGAFLGFSDLLDDTLLVHNSDVISEIDLKGLLSIHKRKKPIATIALTKNRPTDLVTIAGDRVLRFNRATDKKNFTYTGIAVLSPRIRDYFPTGQRFFSLVDHVFKNALGNDEHILAVPVKENWIDIGSPTSYWHAHKLVAEGRLKVKELPCRGPVCVHDTSVVKTKRLKGFVIVGPNTTIDEDVEISNSVVFPNSHVRKGAYSNCLLSDEFCINALAHERIAD